MTVAGQIAQQTTKNHQPRCLMPPIVQPCELARQKLHEIVEADLAPTDVADRETRREKREAYELLLMKVASGA